MPLFLIPPTVIVAIFFAFFALTNLVGQSVLNEEAA